MFPYVPRKLNRRLHDIPVAPELPVSTPYLFVLPFHPKEIMMANLTHTAPSHTPTELTATASGQRTVPTAPPDAQPTVYWGDKVALQVWLLGCALLWMLTLSNLLSNLWKR